VKYVPYVQYTPGARVQKPWTAFANAMALFSEANNGLSGGCVMRRSSIDVLNIMFMSVNVRGTLTVISSQITFMMNGGIST